MFGVAGASSSDSCIEIEVVWESSDQMYKCQTADLWNATYDILRLGYRDTFSQAISE